MSLEISNFEYLERMFQRMPVEAFDMNCWRHLPVGEDLPDDFPDKDNPSLVLRAERGWTCGAVGCIGGWAEVALRLKHGLTDEPTPWSGFRQLIVRGWLGINNSEETLLFYDYPSVRPDEGWKAWMLKRVRRIIETEKIENYRDVPELNESAMGPWT